MDMDTEYAYCVCPWLEPAARHAGWSRSSAVSALERLHRSAGDVVERVGVGAGALAAVQPGQRRHLVGPELEVEQREVLLDALAGHRLREDDVAARDVPTQDDLGRRPPQLLGDRRDRRVVEDLALGDRRPGLGDDLVVGVEGAD